MNRNATGGDPHERARRLIDVERVEGLGNDERRWLQEHLSGCGTCAARAESTDAALRALRSVSVAPPPGLAMMTGLRVRERAAQLKRRRARNAALMVGCGLSWLLGVASAPLVWRMCSWLGGAFNLPRVAWELWFVGWWFVPAAAAGLAILWARSRWEQDGSDLPPSRMGPGPRSNRR